MNKKLKGRVISAVMAVVMVIGMALPVTAAEPTFSTTNKSEDIETEVSEKLSDNLINYIAIASSKQQLTDTQQVVVGIGNGNKKLVEGVLTYKNTYTGDIYQVKCNEKSAEALSFDIFYEGKAEGVYQLVGLEYVIDNEKNNIALSDADLNVSWGVGVEYNSNPDDVIAVESGNEDMDGSIADVSFDVTTEDGQSATAATVSEALEKANGTLSVESNGVVNTKASYETAGDERLLSDSGLTAASNDVINTGAGNTVIVLDPGHGGYDSGATYGGLLEKDLNLSVATYCKNVLEQYGNVTVYMTRYDDTAPGYPVGEDLINRVNFAQRVGANAIVSIHMNSGGGNGVEVYYPNANFNPTVSDIGRGLSYCIYNNIVALGMAERGVKIRNSTDGDGSDYYSIIRNAKARGFAGIIVEHAFIDGDYNRLCDENFLRQLGEADARGIAEYFKLGQEDLSQYEGAFDANIYRFFNEDLWELNDQQCFNHWIEHGIAENRDGSPVFNMSDYLGNNPDLVNAFGWDFRGYARHFSQNGMSEGRKSSDSFSVQSYKNRYVDLRNDFGKELRSYYMHYESTGWLEGREALGYDDRRVGKVTKLHTYDFGQVYDYDFYTTNYGDIKGAFGEDDISTLEHFANYGIYEGRQAINEFNIIGYKNRYLDLRRAYGSNLLDYAFHYELCGKAEGRDASFCPEVIDPEYVFMGTDFSPVYNYDFYQQNNPDVAAAFGYDDMATFGHFLTHGMNEGRRASADFDLWTYVRNYEDLRNAFGWNLAKYYMHYIEFGKAEGRVAV